MTEQGREAERQYLGRKRTVRKQTEISENCHSRIGMIGGPAQRNRTALDELGTKDNMLKGSRWAAHSLQEQIRS